MKLLISGSRSITDYETVKNAIEKGLAELKIKPQQISEFVHGGAKGVDRLGQRWAKENNIPDKIFIPDWNGEGKRAGMLRNIEMCEYVGENGYLVVVHDGESKGTLQCYNYAKNMGIKTAYIKCNKTETVYVERNNPS